MKKILAFLICSLPFAAMAQVTPEAIMGKCPAFPGQQEITRYLVYGDKGVENYLKTLNTALTQIQAALQKQGGNSFSQAQSMGGAEAMSMGKAQADAALRGAGVKTSVSELEKGVSAEKEKQMAEDALRQASGMSMQDLQALGNMSQQEQMAFLQKQGAMGQMMSQGMGSQPAMDMDEDELDMMGEEPSEEYSERAIKLMQLESRMSGVQSWITGLWKSGGYEQKDIALSEDALAQRKKLREDYCNEIMKEWYPLVMERLELMRLLLPDDKIMDNQAALALRLAGMSPAASGDAGKQSVQRAIQYLYGAMDLVPQGIAHIAKVPDPVPPSLRYDGK